jgi:membrane protein YdbS with pleckstrin-like domain
LPSEIHTPQNKLSKAIIKATIIGELIEDMVIYAVLGTLFYLAYLFTWKSWITWILIAITAISVLATIWSIAIRPFLLYKNTRYQIDEAFLQLKSGAFIEKHELVPMTKIQSVETNQGPVMRKYNLCSVSVETTGTSHAINGLPKEIAIELRNQIARYAKLKEVES